MANKTEIKIVGDHIDEFLQELAEEKQAILAEWGEATEAQAKVQIESSPRRVDTGRLRGSITYATASTQSNVESSADSGDSVPKNAADENSVVIGTNVEYAGYVHNGTSKMAPNHFLTDAVNNLQGRGEYEKAVKAHLSKFM